MKGDDPLPQPWECTCRIGGVGSWRWLEVTHLVSPEQREEATAYVECVERYHRGPGGSKDRRFTQDPERMRRKVWLSRIAETSLGRILHQKTAKCQSKGSLGRMPDLSGLIGVRWTEVDPPVLFMKSPRRYARDRMDPLDEPEVLAVGDEREMRFLGWTTQRLVAPDYSEDSPYWVERWQNWAVPVDYLHRLPTPPASKDAPEWAARPISLRHRLVRSA